MSTTSTSSTTESSSQVMEQRPQAGPLPKKRGEIGYREGMDGVEVEPVAVPAPAVLPERHPADRDATPAPAPPSPSSAARNSTSSTTNPSVAHSGDAAAPTTSSGTAATADDASSMTSLGKSKKIPKYFGIRLTTILLLLFQAFILAGTITIWGISIQILTHGSISGNKTNNNNNDNTNDNNSPPGASSAIFVHVVFGIVLLVQLLFLERRIYRVRAERYAHLHPGEVLPTSTARARMLNDPYIAISPWNRPPLPTYAAALAQSGVGTGDVEDHLIAAPPPPAYGNTRGSTLILAGFLRNSLRAQRPPSVHSVASTRTAGERTSRPVSYVTVDEEWEIIQNADRARALEETLDRLEQSPSSRG